MNNEIEVLTQFFAAINRNDMHGITQYFDPQIVRIEPEGFPTAGTYRGIAEVQEHIAKGRGTWAEGTCEPEKFLTQGDKVVVYVHVRVRLKDSLDWVDGRIADGFVFRNGKITHYRSFADRPEALQWAEIEEHEIILSAPQRPPPLRSRLTRRDAAEARWAGQAATIQQMRPARLIAGLFGPVTK